MNSLLSRRGFLKTAAIGSAATITGLPTLSALGKQAHAKMPFKLGVASYSLRKFDRKEAIKMTRQIGHRLYQHQVLPPSP